MLVMPDIDMVDLLGVVILLLLAEIHGPITNDIVLELT